MHRSTRRLAAFILIGMITVLVAGFFAGRIGFEVTNGVSMEPSYHAGDLVVVAAAGSYDAGEVVAYHGGADGQLTVLHRIIGGDASGFVFKGDNNESIDVAHPTADQLIGREVLHLPQIGGFLSSPLVRGLLLILGLAFLGGLMSNREPQRASSIREVAPVPPKVRPPFVLMAVDAVLLIGVLIAFALPSPTPAVTGPATKQTGQLAYNATVPVSDTYPTGQILTGDPVFVKLLNDVDVSFHYDTDAAASSSVTGTGRLDALLSATNGWHTTLALVPATPLDGGVLDLTGTLDMQRILAIGDSVAKATGAGNGAINVAVTAAVDVSVDGHDPVNYSTQLPFQLNAVALTLTGAKPTASDKGPVVSNTTPLGAVPPATPPAGDSHRALALGLVAALVLCGGATIVLWPSNDDDRILERIPLATRALDFEPGDSPRIKLADRTSLQQVATRLDKPVVQVGTNQFMVVTTDALYWVETGTKAPAASTPPTDPSETPAPRRRGSDVQPPSTATVVDEADGTALARRARHE